MSRQDYYCYYYYYCCYYYYYFFFFYYFGVSGGVPSWPGTALGTGSHEVLPWASPTANSSEVRAQDWPRPQTSYSAERLYRGQVRQQGPGQ